YLAANWMLGQNSYEQAEKMLERALTVDKAYAPALNDLAYCYAQNREFAKAFEAMGRYVALLPTLPNPQDSYAEILRMSGNFEGALEHYRAALKIDPSFDYSQLGLGDTYALMGNQPQARAEYEKAIHSAHTEADRLAYALQKATTWARESNFAEADKAFDEIAEKAHAGGFSREEAQARVLRYRAVRADHAGNAELAGQSMQQLETMAGSTHSFAIQSSYHGAA